MRLAALFLAAAAPAAAQEGYITTYGHHVEEGELEVMLMMDLTSPSEPRREEGQGLYLSQMLEIGYGVTSQLEVELMVEGFEDVETGEGTFTGFRLEAHYRLFEQEVPLNPTIYFEYEDLDPRTRFKMEISGWVLPPYEEEEGEEKRERILESRVILSQDFGRWNVAFNWINETDLRNGDTAFGYTLGVSLSLHDEEHEEHGHHDKPKKDEKIPEKERPFVRVGAITLELLGTLGDTRMFGLDGSRQEHYLQPNVMFHLGERMMVMLGFAFGLTDASDEILRLSVGWSF